MNKPSDHNIDKLYKEVFEDADSSFDKAGMWSGMQNKLPDKYRGLLFWSSLGTSILLLVYFWVLLERPTNTQREIVSGNPTEESQQLIRPDQSPIPSTVSKDETMHPISPISSESAENDESSEMAAPHAVQTGSKSTTTAMRTPPLDRTPDPSERTGTSSNAMSHSSPSNIKSESPAEHGQAQSGQNQTTAQSTPGELLKRSGGPVLQDDPLAIDKSKTELAEHVTTDPLPLVHLSPFEVNPKLVYKDPKWSQCEVSKRGLGFFSEVYAFGGYPIIDNELKPSNDNTDFLKDWNDSESAVGSYAFGTMIGIKTRWGGSFSAGVEYQQIINKVKREQTVIERVTVYDEMAYFYLDSNNNKVWVADSVTSTRRYHRELQMKKTHTLLNIPLSLGYHFNYDRWRFGVQAGVNVHLFKEFEGKVLDPSGQLIDAGTGTNFEVYDTDMSLSIIGGFDLGYLIGDHLELYLSPRFRYHSDSWLDESHPLESYIQLAGLRGGARYHF